MPSFGSFRLTDSIGWLDTGMSIRVWATIFS